MKIRLAHPDDDEALRELMRSTVMPGHIKMIYAREPDFFEGERVGREFSQVIVVEDDDRILAVGSRSVSTLHINGQPRALGYLSGLRLDESVRNGNVLARGYSFLKRLHGDRRTAAYLTSIVHGNDKAERILTSRRAGLPAYMPMGMYLTHVIPVSSRCRTKTDSGIEIVAGAQVRQNDLLAFLEREGPKRQFFPVCGDGGNDLVSVVGRENILVAIRDGSIAGTMGVWNQQKFKQYIVADYSSPLGILRPLLNFGLALKSCRALPAKGERLHSAAISLLSVENDEPRIFQLLLRRAMEKAAREGLHQLVLGLHERDPLCDNIKGVFHLRYKSRLYLACWDDGLSLYNEIEPRRTPYLEVGML